MYMNLTVKYNATPMDWDGFTAKEAEDGGFLQSWQWGEFQSDLGRKIFRLTIVSEQKIAAVALVIKQEMPLGFCYLYCPRGPVIGRNFDQAEILDFLFLTIRKIAQAEQAIFFRLDPPWTDDGILKRAGLEHVGDVQPASSLILDLSLPEAELMAQMKPKTRYNIKLAQKHQLAVMASDNNERDFGEFWQLLEKTSERDNIKSHKLDYYQRMLKCPGIRLVFVKDGEKPVAASVMARFGQWEIYLHGASDYDYREKMGPYLLQWQMILEAKKNKCRHYDFWGADALKWPGVTRFKQGFAPAIALTEYVGAYDLIYNKWLYRAYNLAKKIKK